MEHDTEEFHRATQEQNGLKQQYIELLEAMGIPVTDELLQVRAQRTSRKPTSSGAHSQREHCPHTQASAAKLSSTRGARATRFCRH